MGTMPLFDQLVEAAAHRIYRELGSTSDDHDVAGAMQLVMAIAPFTARDGRRIRAIGSLPESSAGRHPYLTALNTSGKAAESSPLYPGLIIKASALLVVRGLSISGSTSNQMLPLSTADFAQVVESSLPSRSLRAEMLITLAEKLSTDPSPKKSGHPGWAACLLSLARTEEVCTIPEIIGADSGVLD